MLNSLASVMESSNVCLLAAIPSRSPRNAGGMSRLNRTGGHMPDPQKFNLREWLVPPILLPIFLGLVAAGAVIVRWCLG
jgi:hypothetical protein